MSAPYLYTPHNISPLEIQYSPYAPPGHTPLFHPGYHPSHWNPVVPPSVYDDDDSDSKVNDYVHIQSIRGPPGPNNLCPRPDYWRPIYPNGPRACPLKRLFTSSVHLDLVLRFKKNTHPIHHDLRFALSMDPHLYLPTLKRVPTTHDLVPLATDPPLLELRLWHRLLPWYITIVAINRHHGVTVRDVLEQLHAELCGQRITLYDYWTDALTPRDRERVDQSCRTRIWETTAGFGNMDAAICRVDYLGEDYVFVGLVPSPDGSFEIKTTAKKNGV